MVKLSAKFELTIPKAIRESMGLIPGAKFDVIPSKYGITLIPLPRKKR